MAGGRVTKYHTQVRVILTIGTCNVSCKTYMLSMLGMQVWSLQLQLHFCHVSHAHCWIRWVSGATAIGQVVYTIKIVAEVVQVVLCVRWRGRSCSHHVYVGGFVGLWGVCQTLIVELIVNVLCADLVVVVSSVPWVVVNSLVSVLGVNSRAKGLVLYTLGLVVSVGGSGYEWYVYVVRWLVVVSTLLVVAKGIAGIE